MGRFKKLVNELENSDDDVLAISKLVDISYKLSNSIKKRFVKDTGLPINIYQEPYFLDSLITLNKDFDSINKFKQLIKLLEFQGLESGTYEKFFFEEGSNIVEKVQKELISYDGYKKVNHDNNFFKDELIFIRDTKKEYKFNKNLYTQQNINKKFISIDLKQANFNTFCAFDIIDKEKYKTYQDMIKNISNTNFEYYIESKQIRQIIFGGLMPKKVRQISEYIILNLLKFIEKNENLKNILIFDNIIINNDEIVFELNENMNKIKLDELLNLFLIDKKYQFKFNDYNFPLNIETFILKDIIDKNDKVYFIKEYFKLDNNNQPLFIKQELKTVPGLFYLQFYKKMNDLVIGYNDLVFFYEGQIARFETDMFTK
jgi:hypothetical protein